MLPPNGAWSLAPHGGFLFSAIFHKAQIKASFSLYYCKQNLQQHKF
jgi:hypothetical protein